MAEKAWAKIVKIKGQEGEFDCPEGQGVKMLFMNAYLMGFYDAVREMKNFVESGDDADITLDCCKCGDCNSVSSMN
jgi:hypothetical protein